MYALGIPTTRSLAVTATGGTVYREQPLPGAVLARVAAVARPSTYTCTPIAVSTSGSKAQPATCTVDAPTARTTSTTPRGVRCLGDPNQLVKNRWKLRLPYDEHASPVPLPAASAAAFGWYGV